MHVIANVENGKIQGWFSRQPSNSFAYVFYFKFFRWIRLFVAVAIHRTILTRCAIPSSSLSERNFENITT